MVAAGKRKSLLLLGILLVGAGLALAFAPTSIGWLARFWPAFLILAGLVRMVSFAIERNPRWPLLAMSLMSVGTLMLAAKLHPNLNLLQVYGQCWPLLLLIFGGVELIRYYFYPHTLSRPPRLFTPAKLAIIFMIITTGVLANRMAKGLLPQLPLLELPISFNIDSIGSSYNFSDEPFVDEAIKPGTKVIVSNSYGDIKVTGGAPALRVKLSKKVRAWNESRARELAARTHLVIDHTPEGINISTNRDQSDGRLITNIEIKVPASTPLSLAGSFGLIEASGIRGPAQISSKSGRVKASDIGGDCNLELSHSQVDISKIGGSVRIAGASRVRVAQVAGSVQIEASGGEIEIRDIAGPVQVDAPFSRIRAQGLTQKAQLSTERAEVKIKHASDVIIQAPYSDVRADQLSGSMQVNTAYSSVQARLLAGGLQVSAEQSSVIAEDIHGPVQVETSNASVVIKNFYDGLRVRTSYKDVVLTTATQPTADIEAETRYGGIKLALPHWSQFQLEAVSGGGLVKTIGFSQLPESAQEKLIIALGLSGPKIKLKTLHGDITIQAGSDLPRTNLASPQQHFAQNATGVLRAVRFTQKGIQL
jgi:uncharacterized membrane protein HdeD (DUF308 family)